MNESLKHTPLFAWHQENGGKLVDFAGWAMPVQYGSIVEEHQNVRSAVGVFDVSHMARLRFDGADAGTFLDGLLTRRVAEMPLGKIRYSLVTNEQGGILDDVLAYRMETPSGRRYYLLVVNASNRQKIVDWIRQQQGGAGDIGFSDRTEETAMIAVQGPRAAEILSPIIKAKIGELGYYSGVVTEHLGRPCTVSRTGYTGEDGFELIVRAEDAMDVWTNLFRGGRDAGIAAAGLGARDTLRLEAAMPLYGHELSEDVNPYQAGLGFAVNLKDRQFVGRDALAAIKQAGGQPVRIGLELSGRRVAREHSPVLLDGQPAGEVTSGTFSPTFQKPIAMAYVSAEAAAGRDLEVEIRGRRESARAVKLPFYRRSS